VTAARIPAEIRAGLLLALLAVGLTGCEERSAMTRPESGSTTGQSTGRSSEVAQPSNEELTRRCMEILERISPIGQALTPEDEKMAGLVERPGQPTVQTAPLGRPHVTVDVHGIIVKKRCY
jgi:hypothetical protein